MMEGTTAGNKMSIAPRISEVNGAQHIGASVIPVWLEDAAVDYFKRAIGEAVPSPMLSPSMRKSEIDFLREVFYPDIADITTTLEHVGTSSIVLQQQIVQRAAVVCTARSVWVNTAAGGATPIPANVAALLSNL